jgi:hypothetical protein
MLGLGVNGTAVDRASALLAPHNPGLRQPQIRTIHDRMIGEEMANHKGRGQQPLQDSGYLNVRTVSTNGERALSARPLRPG